MIITTKDKHKISVLARTHNRKEAIIVAPGFYNNKDTYLFRLITNMFYKKYDVFCFDFRGHGQSNGLFSWTTYERLDLRAVISYVKDQGYQQVGVVGFSLGGATALIECSENKGVNSVIAVSSPFDFWHINSHFWEPEMLKDFRLNFGSKGKGKGVRPGNIFLPKIKPIEAVKKRVNLCPILFIHGRKDWLIKDYHSDRLYDQAIGFKELKKMDGAGHAEKIYDDQPDQFEDICFGWFDKTFKSGNEK